MAKVRMIQDPVESAKVPRGAAEAAMFPEKNSLAHEPAKEETVVKTETPAQPPPFVPEDDAKKAVAASSCCSEKYVVLEGKIVSFSGHITFLPTGTIVCEDSYGPGVIEKLQAANVKMEKLA